MFKWLELGISTQVMKEQSGMEWWPHHHNEMELEHGNEDHGEQAKE